MSPVIEKVWSGVDWLTPGAEDNFLLGTTVPKSRFIDESALPEFYKTFAGGSDNVGLLNGPDTIADLEVFTDFAGTTGGRKIINGSTDINNPRVIANKIIYGPVVQASTANGGNVKFYNCFFTMDAPWTQVNSGNGPAYVGLADARTNAGTARWTFERCHFDPTEEFAHPGISAIMGHHFTAYRCTWQRVVDGASIYRAESDPSAVLAVEILGCLNIYNSFFYDSVQRVVHPSDYYTHNDAIQNQGGGPGDGYTYALDARGNLFIGYNFLADGVTIPPTGISNGNDASRHLAHQGIIIQQNTKRSTPSTSRVSENWFGGWHQPITAKTHALSGSNNTVSDGTPYNITMENNIIAEDDQRLNGSTSGTDYYGVTGGHVHLVRIDPDISINGAGQEKYPPDLTPVPIGSGNKYANTPNIHANRRGQDMYARRDATYV